MVFYQVILFVAVLLHLALIGSPTTWVHTAPRALTELAGTASASASSPSSPPGSVIADLRRRKSEELTKDVDSLNGSDFEEEGSENEASPSLLKKKIGKILTKLRLIAQLKNAYHYKPEESEPEDTTMSMAVDPSETPPIGTSENIQQIPAAAPPILPLQVNQIDDKLMELKEKPVEKLVEEPRSPLRTLGVFFAELLGSIVGLTYGAVAQISAGGQSPVTLSTSEGL